MIPFAGEHLTTFDQKLNFYFLKTRFIKDKIMSSKAFHKKPSDIHLELYVDA